jgi:hypothetical protein
VFSDLVLSYIHPSGDNCGDKPQPCPACVTFANSGCFGWDMLWEWPHWNEGIYGDWSLPLRVDQVGSYVGDYLNRQPGVYVLIGLAEADIQKPAIINRVIGQDQTGTLYVGCAELIRPRLQQLCRSVDDWKKKGFEHGAGRLLRGHPLLHKRFPTSKLAIRWSYTDNYLGIENNLLVTYFRSFGEGPPLNRKWDIIWS